MQVVRQILPFYCASLRFFFLGNKIIKVKQIAQCQIDYLDIRYLLDLLHKLFMISNF